MRSARSVAVLVIALGGCTVTPRTTEPPPPAAPDLPASSSAAHADATPPPAPETALIAPPTPAGAVPPAPAPAPEGPIVVGTRAPVTLSAPGFPRVDRTRSVVTVADTGDDRFAFQISLSLLELSPGKSASRVVLDVFTRRQFEALEADPPALDRAVRQAAQAVNDTLKTAPLGTPMVRCGVAPREVDDASSCAAGQTLQCGDLAATYEGRAGQLRHPKGTARHPLWAKTTLRSSEHRASFEVVACLREAAFDPETRLLAARVDRQCVASGGDWCSREPVWTVVALR